MESKTKMQEFYSSQINGQFVWTILDNQPKNKGDVICSNVFEIHEPDGRITEWKMYFFPKGEKRSQDGDITLLLSSLNSFDVKINFTLSVLDSSGNRQNSIMYKDHVFSKFGEEGDTCGSHNFCKEKTIQENPQWFRNGCLSFMCDITLMSERSCHAKAEDPLSKKTQKQLCEDMSNLFLDESNSDIEIKCGTSSFPCHRSILSARSPVFRAMLQADMEEKREGIIYIKDFSPDVVKAMLNYMYTSTLDQGDQDQEHLKEVFKAADKYQLDLLKKACEQNLCHGLTTENCLIYLVLGDMYKAEMLRRLSKKKFFTNAYEIMFTQRREDWKRFVQSRPDLKVELTTELANRAHLQQGQQPGQQQGQQLTHAKIVQHNGRTYLVRA